MNAGSMSKRTICLFLSPSLYLVTLILNPSSVVATVSVASNLGSFTVPIPNAFGWKNKEGVLTSAVAPNKVITSPEARAESTVLYWPLASKIAGPATHCTIEVISKIATSLQGGKKGVNNRDFTILINQSELNPSLATELAKTIFEKGNSRVIVASLRNIHHPILEIYQT